jgi:hypothetical protein
LTGGTELTRGHEENKLVQVWIPTDKYEQPEEFLYKFSAGEAFSERLRQFILWIVNQKKEINRAVLAQRLEEVRKKKEAEEVHCLRGVMKPWQWERLDLREHFCQVCEQRFSREDEKCREEERRRKASES